VLAGEGNTRTGIVYPPFPLTMVRGKDSQLWDADDHEYIDFLGEYTAGLYGHSNPVIRSAIDRALMAALTPVVRMFRSETGGVLCTRFPH